MHAGHGGAGGEAWLEGAQGLARVRRYWDLLAVPAGLLALCTACTLCASISTLAVAAVFGKGDPEASTGLGRGVRVCVRVQG